MRKFARYAPTIPLTCSTTLTGKPEHISIFRSVLLYAKLYLLRFEKCHAFIHFPIQGVPKKVQHEKTNFENMKITNFEITMNIIMGSNLLCVSGFFPVNFGASVHKL